MVDDFTLIQVRMQSLEQQLRRSQQIVFTLVIGGTLALLCGCRRSRAVFAHRT